MGILGLGGTDPYVVFDPDKFSTLLAAMPGWSFLDSGRGKAAAQASEAKRARPPHNIARRC